MDSTVYMDHRTLVKMQTLLEGMMGARFLTSSAYSAFVILWYGTRCFCCWWTMKSFFEDTARFWRVGKSGAVSSRQEVNRLVSNAEEWPMAILHIKILFLGFHTRTDSLWMNNLWRFSKWINEIHTSYGKGLYSFTVPGNAAMLIVLANEEQMGKKVSVPAWPLIWLLLPSVTFQLGYKMLKFLQCIGLIHSSFKSYCSMVPDGAIPKFSTGGLSEAQSLHGLCAGNCSPGGSEGPECYQALGIHTGTGNCCLGGKYRGCRCSCSM